MSNWLSKLEFDPLAPLLESGRDAIEYFARRDLLRQPVEPVTSIWDLPQPRSILKKQRLVGCWNYPGKGQDYQLLETFKQMQILVHEYEFNRTHPAIAKASEFFFSCQTEEGDFRGILGNQYAPYYNGMILTLLLKSGYAEDPRVETGIQWLLSMRQNDGGWVIGSPGVLGLKLTVRDLNEIVSDRTLPPLAAFDRSRPFSHAGTGMVIRALAASEKYRHSPEALTAARLLKSHFFREDNYSSYQSPEHWVRFQFPFWWNNLVAALDSLSLIGFTAADRDIQRALRWLKDHQTPSGLWEISYSSIHKSSENRKSAESRLWISLAICRLLQRFYD